MCGKSTWFATYTRGYKKCCSVSCAKQYSLLHNKEEIMAKHRATMLKNHGVENISLLPNINELRAEGCKKRIGIPLTEEHKAATKRTNLERYGVEYPSQSPIVRARVDKTMEERFGGYYVGKHGMEHRHALWKIKRKKFIEENYNVTLLEDIVSSKETIPTKCNACGTEFDMDISDGGISRCPKCFFQPANRSKLEQEICHIVHDMGFIIKTNAKSKELIYPYELDIWIPSKRIAIEFNGDYWHCSERIGKDYHTHKLELCQAKGINLIHNKQGVINRLKGLLGVPMDRVYARKCKVVNVSHQESKTFLENNHLQGYVNSSEQYGLEYKNELVMLMTVGKPRYNTKANLELLRVCTKDGVNVIGGGSKLLSHIKKQNMGKVMVSYHDRRWGDSKFYELLGFEKAGISPPGYVYLRRYKKISRYQAQKHKLPELLGEGFDPSLTEVENMIRAGFSKLYDCGQDVYIIQC
jgi:hypothetical protein